MSDLLKAIGSDSNHQRYSKSGDVGVPEGLLNVEATVETTVETMPAVLWDAVAAMNCGNAVLAGNGRVIEFLKDQYRHCKPILLIGESANLLKAAAIPKSVANLPDKALIFAGSLTEKVSDHFLEAIAAHRNFQRESATAD